MQLSLDDVATSMEHAAGPGPSTTASGQLHISPELPDMDSHHDFSPDLSNPTPNTLLLMTG